MTSIALRSYCLAHLLLGFNSLAPWAYHHGVEALANFALAVLVVFLHRHREQHSKLPPGAS